jgi:hypothetical protein
MALATAWCNVSDQGQAKVKVYCFFFFCYSGERQNFLTGILRAIFLEGG